MLILNVLSMPHSSNHGHHGRVRDGDVRGRVRNRTHHVHARDGDAHGRAHNRSHHVHAHDGDVRGRAHNRSHHVHAHGRDGVRAHVRGYAHDDVHVHAQDGGNRGRARSHSQHVRVQYFLNQLSCLYCFLYQSYFTSIKRLNNYLYVSIILQHRFLKINT